MSAPCVLIETRSLREDVALASAVSLVGRDEADAAVAMLGVVPGHEGCDPSARALERVEGLEYSGRYFSIRKRDSAS